MVSSRLAILLILLSLVLIIITQANAQPRFSFHFCQPNRGNYTTNSTYQNNLNILLSNLSSNTDIDYGFYNFSYGQNPDTVNAIGLCRGDVKPEECRSCLNNSRILLPELCPNRKESIGWYEKCMLRYSNRSIFGIMETGPAFHSWIPDNATSVEEFNKALRDLLESLKSQASSGDSLRKYAAGNATGPDFQTIYAVVQCTPDLSQLQCNDCLVGAFSEIPQCCNGKRGGRIGRPSCGLRFANFRFYEPTSDETAPMLPSSPPQSAQEEESNLSRIVIVIVVPIVAFLILLLISICIFLRVRDSKEHIDHEIKAMDEIKSTESLQFDFGTIRAATNNFSNESKLGQGGFGAVYKGQLPNGQEIAVKRLSQGSGQGDIEFKNEVLLVAKLQHRNLVRLLGFCLKGNERLLIYEFVPNKSLDYFIFDPAKHASLDWGRRHRIIVGIARGVLYLHEDSRLRIIHRDLKASNILLDADMNPKISDFGMARLFMTDQTHGNTNRIVGTYGYMAPEYVMHGQFSVKSDVFSFGVLVLEILSGKKNTSFRYGENAEDLLTFAWKNWKEGTITNLIDPTLNGWSRNEIMRCIHIGLLCVQENIAGRPTMASVVLMLNSYSLTLPVPSQPAFFMSDRSGKSGSKSLENSSSEVTRSSDPISVQASVNEDSITEMYPR